MHYNKQSSPLYTATFPALFELHTIEKYTIILECLTKNHDTKMPAIYKLLIENKQYNIFYNIGSIKFIIKNDNILDHIVININTAIDSSVENFNLFLNLLTAILLKTTVEIFNTKILKIRYNNLNLKEHFIKKFKNFTNLKTAYFTSNLEKDYQTSINVCTY